MIGYVRVDAGELRVREHQYYRALYCGRCHRMGKCTGQCARLSLSYDFVFLAALRLALTGESVTVKRQRCIVHPLRSRQTVQPCAALDFCADASALLVHHKLCDDLHDERGLKKLRARLSLPFFAAGYRRAKRRHPSPDAQILAHLHRLSALEDASEPVGADACAEVFGDLMADLAAEGLDEEAARLARAIARAVGHWLYLVDAADDFDEDRKRGRFNPLRASLGDSPTDADWNNLRLSLTAHLCDAERAFLLIDRYPSVEVREILANLLYRGLPAVAERVLSQKTAARPKGTEP